MEIILVSLAAFGAASLTFFSGFGLGVRIRNERLVFETITLRLGYYPNHPEKSFPLFLDVYGEQRLNPKNFYVKKPAIIRYE